jgi:D-amino-acid oxidase
MFSKEFMNFLKNQINLRLPILLFATTIVGCAKISTTPEVRHINPPHLSAENLGRRILCYRPMRRGTPNMTVEKCGEQVIAHDYGHGGSGLTLAPGSASYVNDLLINSEHAKDLTKDTPITIIGGGVLGTFTAYDLIQKGYKNITIMAESFKDLASHRCGGLIAPVSMDNDPAMQKIVDQIGIDAYKFYASIAKSQHPHFKKFVRIVPTYFENREESGLEAYVEKKVMRPAKDVVLDFGNGTKRTMVSYDDGMFVDPAEMMVDLTQYLKDQNVRFVHKKINKFSDVKTKYVIDCTGLGSATLNKDDAMVSVQGHLIMLKDQKPEDLQYMILVYFKEGKTKSGQKIKRSFYLFPKHFPNTSADKIGVLGGTFIEGATEKTPNTEEFETLVKGAKDFYGIKG